MPQTNPAYTSIRSTPLYQVAPPDNTYAVADAHGNVTLSFTNVYSSRIWTGTITVVPGPGSALSGTTWVISRDGTQPFLSWSDNQVIIDIQGRDGQQITIQGTGLTPGANVRAVWAGENGSVNDPAPIVSPWVSGSPSLAVLSQAIGASAQDIANAISQTGVPAIDNPAPVSVNINTPVPAGGSVSTAELDFSRYQSWVGTAYAAATASGTGTNPWTRFTFQWSLKADNFDPLHVEDWVVPNTPFNFTFVLRNDCQGPCFGDSCKVTVTNYDSQPSVFTLGMFGSYRQRIKSKMRGRYQWNADGTPNEAAGLGSDNVLGSFNVTGLGPGALSSENICNLHDGESDLVFFTTNTSVAGLLQVHLRPQPFSIIGTEFVFLNAVNQPWTYISNLTLSRRVNTLRFQNTSTTATINASAMLLAKGEYE